MLLRCSIRKVDRDITYVAMVVPICCKLLFPMFHLFFRRMLQVCLSGCCICLEICFISVLSRCCVCFCNGFKCSLGVFVSVSDACFKCFICLHTYVASVVFGCLKSRLDVVSPSSSSAALHPS